MKNVKLQEEIQKEDTLPELEKTLQDCEEALRESALVKQIESDWYYIIFSLIQ